MLENAHHHIQETVNQLNEIPLNMEEAGAHLKQAEDIVNRASRESEELVEQVMLIEKSFSSETDSEARTIFYLNS